MNIFFLCPWELHFADGRSLLFPTTLRGSKTWAAKDLVNGITNS